ncbi:hypothetical protein BD626DRAFT_554152 [Schizophyllum amplum]|uniref:Uncharacterized protein n=1 Tax=Schizophyllum amplum TaxID=97359 RepID=A0A550CYF7_9AGAR|nr:hypothetical protein BD626DRAFT_554152 [Auriculariopsis ampla]
MHFSPPDKSRHAATERERAGPQFPPDGDEILSEWQEGPHTVIERRGGPGEDVEVEVKRHTHDEESVGGKVKHAEEKVEHAVQRSKLSPTHNHKRGDGKA